jgi:hypothetical protein
LDGAKWDRVTFDWGKRGDLDTMVLKWYVPGEEEVGAAQMLMDRKEEDAANLIVISSWT